MQVKWPLSSSYRYMQTIDAQNKISDINCQNNTLKILQAAISIARKLTRRTTLTATGSYAKADYTFQSGTDDIYKGELTLEHSLNKNTSLKVGYSVETKDSNVVSGYLRHLVYASLVYDF